MGQHLGPAGVFIKILMSHKFKTVYKQAILLLVCFHVSYKGNARVAGSQWCFAPTEFKHFWGLGTSARAVSLFAAGFGGGRGWCCPLPFTQVLCPLPSAGQSCFASHGSRLVRVKILLIPGAELVLNPLESGRTGPTSPCAHPSRASPAILGIPMALLVPVQLQQPWSCRGAAFFTRLERSPRILELHLSSSVLWDMWKASKTDTCWLWSSQVFFPKCLWPLSWVFTFKKIQACVGCKRQGGVGGITVSTVTEIPSRLEREMEVDTLRETQSPWDRHGRKQEDALCSVWLLAKMSAVSPTERERQSQEHIFASFPHAWALLTRTIPFCTFLGIFSNSSSVQVIVGEKKGWGRKKRAGEICLVVFQISSVHRCFLIPLAYIFHSP